MPIGTDVLGVGYGYTTGDLSFDPVLEIEDATVEMHTALASFTHYFALAHRTARVDVVVPTRAVAGGRPGRRRPENGEPRRAG